MAPTSAAKADALSDLGTDRVVTCGEDLAGVLGTESVDLVVDNVAGDGFPTMLKLLRRGRRYTSSGAIAGPIVDLDMRDTYMKNISLIGTAPRDAPVGPSPFRCIEAGEIRPLLAAT